MEKDSDLLNKKKTVQISVTDKDGKEHPLMLKPRWYLLVMRSIIKPKNEWWSKDP